MLERQIRSLSQEDPLGKEMATYSSILAWKTPWTEETGRLYSPWDRKRVRYDLPTKQHFIVIQNLKIITKIKNLSQNSHILVMTDGV